MYRPKHFEEQRPQALLDLIEHYPLATIVYSRDGMLAANHAPLLFFDGDDGSNVLRGHVARANPLWQEVADGRPALAVFNGPDAYVSPNFYPTKQDTGEVVPTWNFAVVHVHGRLRAIDDVEWVRAFVVGLTDRNEAKHARPWAVTDAPDSYIDMMLRAIVGIELAIERIEGKFKLSQNRSEADQAGVISGLGRSAAHRDVEVADLMKRQSRA